MIDLCRQRKIEIESWRCRDERGRQIDGWMDGQFRPTDQYKSR